MSEGRRSVETTTRAGMSSEELLRRMRTGDGEAADRLFARYLPILYRWAHRRIPYWARGGNDTADVVHDATLQALRHIPTFEPRRDGALFGYLRRSLANRIHDQFRYAARRPASVPLDENHGDGAYSPLEIAITHENRERYARALEKLRPGDRKAIVSRLELGYSYEQLAVALEKPTPLSARLAVRRALLRLARQMEHA